MYVYVEREREIDRVCVQRKRDNKCVCSERNRDKERGRVCVVRKCVCREIESLYSGCREIETAYVCECKEN